MITPYHLGMLMAPVVLSILISFLVLAFFVVTAIDRVVKLSDSFTLPTEIFLYLCIGFAGFAGGFGLGKALLVTLNLI